jgi:uncharacterized glyoxalase superfamily protein PhnB
MANVKPVPEGFHTVTPHLVVRDAKKAIDFYQKAFGAQVLNPPHLTPDGKVMHASIKIGDSIIMLADEFPEMGGSSAPQSPGNTPLSLHLYVPDVDSTFNRAVSAGAQVKMPVTDMFWGDRYGQVVDPSGHVWSVATHKEEVTPAEMERRGKEMFASMKEKKTA